MLLEEGLLRREAFDLILCRNVTIYFGPDIVHRVATQMHQCLVEGGWLSVGHARGYRAERRSSKARPASISPMRETGKGA